MRGNWGGYEVLFRLPGTALLYLAVRERRLQCHSQHEKFPIHLFGQKNDTHSVHPDASVLASNAFSHKIVASNKAFSRRASSISCSEFRDLSRERKVSSTVSSAARRFSDLFVNCLCFEAP
jgi:hypothetical protein